MEYQMRSVTAFRYVDTCRPPGFQPSTFANIGNLRRFRFRVGERTKRRTFEFHVYAKHLLLLYFRFTWAFRFFRDFLLFPNLFLPGIFYGFSSPVWWSYQSAEMYVYPASAYITGKQTWTWELAGCVPGTSAATHHFVMFERSGTFVPWRTSPHAKHISNCFVTFRVLFVVWTLRKKLTSLETMGGGGVANGITCERSSV